jgi:hypothetical protein
VIVSGGWGGLAVGRIAGRLMNITYLLLRRTDGIMRATPHRRDVMAQRDIVVKCGRGSQALTSPESGGTYVSLSHALQLYA